MLFNLSKTITNWENYYYTLYLALTTTSYGIIFTFFPNITVDMKYILNTTMSMISLYTTIETVGRILGTLVPLFYKYLNRQIVMAIFFLLLTITCSIVPVVPNLWLFYVCAFVSGFSSSIVSSGYPVWLIEIWKDKSGPILQIHEFGFGIGSTLATVILKPYLVGETGTDSENEAFIPNVLNNSQKDSVDIDRRARLMWPSLITGLCILPIPIFSLIMYCIKPYKPPEKQSKQNDENTNTENIKLFDRPETPRRTFRVVCALWYTAYVMFETMFLKYAVTYFQYCPQHLTAQKSAEIFFISTAVFTVFRGINVFIGFKVKMFYIICYHYVILIIGVILLVIGQNYLTVLWASSIVLFWGFSSMYAGIFSYTGDHLTMTNQLSTIYLLIRALFTVVTPLLIGFYIEDYSEIFIIIEIFYLSISLVLFVAIIYLIRKYSKLSDKKQNEN